MLVLNATALLTSGAIGDRIISNFYFNLVQFNQVQGFDLFVSIRIHKDMAFLSVEVLGAVLHVK